MIKYLLIIGWLICCIYFNAKAAAMGFQPYNTQGDNIIHVTTADFDGVGAKDYVVAMTTEGKVIAFKRLDQITDPKTNNRIWEYSELPTMGIRIFAGNAVENSPGDEVILPGTDGHLRIISSEGKLLWDKAVSTGALYTAAIAKGSGGQTVIATSGVDGLIHFLNSDGTEINTVRPITTKKGGVSGLIRHLVAGDFDGNGVDEIVSFLNQKSFEGNNFIDVTDLSTYSRPAYFNGNTDPIEDNVVPGLGFTDKQLPFAYDMDGDGRPELAAHWGVFHPEDGSRTSKFSTMFSENEKMPLSLYQAFAKNYLIQNHGFEKSDKEDLTNTGKYLLQHGVPGDFDNDGKAELFTVYGDDLFLSQYNFATKVLTISDYTWAHSLYHFTSAACLNDRSGGADKIVLGGPATGDDHFYVVDVTKPTWRNDARTIYKEGNFAKIEDNLDQLTNGIENFSGTVGNGNDPIWYIDYFASSLWWEMTPENCEIHAQEVYDAQQEWYDKIGGRTGYRSSRIRLTASVNSAIWGISNEASKETVTAEGVVEFCRALAKKGAYFCLNIGHGGNIYMHPETLAECYEASVVDGECYMMARTKELLEPEYFNVYKPHLDALIAKANQIGAKPPMVMLCAKGAIFSSMPQSQGEEFFPKYKDVIVPGVENSNVTVLEWSLAERVGMWLNGDVERWGCNVIGDNLAANRVAEWGGMRNAHIVLRQMLSQYALGASVFRVTSVTALENPLYERGDVTDKNKAWTQVFQKGVLNFLKIVEKGIYPYSPKVDQVKGISPVSVALYNRSERLTEQSINHDHYKYQPETNDYVINNLACWNAYTDVPETDMTAFVYGTKRRWDNLFPSSPGGFVPLVPFRQKAEVQNQNWSNIAYQTNGDSWDGLSLNGAKETISTEIQNQRKKLDFYINGECFWQITQQKDDPYTYFVFLMGNSVLSPMNRTVFLKAGNGISGACQVFDQLDENTLPIGILSNLSDSIEIDIPVGAPRFLMIKLSQLPNGVSETQKSQQNNIRVFPNPANDVLYIKSSASMKDNTDVRMFNCHGKVVYQGVINNSLKKINVGNLAPGLYILYLGDANLHAKVLIH